MGFALLVAASAVLFVWYLQVLVGPWFKKLFAGKSTEERTAEILKRRADSQRVPERAVRYAVQEDPEFEVRTITRRDDVTVILTTCVRGRGYDAALEPPDNLIQPTTFSIGDEVQFLLRIPGERTQDAEIDFVFDNPPGTAREYRLEINLHSETVKLRDRHSA